jgi:serine/threonine protein kinase
MVLHYSALSLFVHFQQVFMCKEIDTGEILAMKVLKKQEAIDDNECDQVLSENNVLRKIKHPFLVVGQVHTQSG